MPQTLIFIILGHFLPFDSPNNPRNQSSLKMKKAPPAIIILHLHTTNDYYMMCGSWDIKHDRQNILPCWAIFCPLPHLNLKNQNFEKMEKKPWRYHHVTHVYQKLWFGDVWFLRYGVQQMDGQTDGKKKWHVEVGAPRKNRH